MPHKHSHPELSDSLTNTSFKEIEAVFDAGETLSIGAKQMVKCCKIDGNICIIKRYDTTGPFKSIRSILELSRADNSCKFAKYLEKFKIPCPKHIVAIKQLSFANSTTYLVMEKAPGIPLFDFIQADSTLTLSEITIQNIAELITRMQWLGIAHGDLHTRNFIIADDDTVQIIDLDNCKISKNRREKDIERFTKAVNHGSRYQKELISALKKAMEKPIDLN